MIAVDGYCILTVLGAMLLTLMVLAGVAVRMSAPNGKTCSVPLTASSSLSTSLFVVECNNILVVQCDVLGLAWRFFLAD